MQSLCPFKFVLWHVETFEMKRVGLAFFFLRQELQTSLKAVQLVAKHQVLSAVFM
jgi:predicted cobalt transporter CbtA